MTGQAGKVARGLRTVGANITQLAQGAKTFDIQVKGTTKSIQLWNDAGTDMLNTYQVLEQISQYWEDMTNAEKSSLAIGLAKKTQMDTFLAVMGNFETAEKAYTTALLAEGSALKENEKYMESIAAQQNNLKREWENLIRSMPFDKIEKGILAVGTAFLKFANNDIVQTITQIAAVSLAFGGLLKAGSMLIPLVESLNLKFAQWMFEMVEVQGASISLGSVITGLTEIMLSNPLFWGTAAAALVMVVIKAIDHFTVSLEEATDALKTINDAVNETQGTIETLRGKIAEIGEQIDSLNEKKLQISDPQQLAELQGQTNELTRQETILRNQLELEKLKLETQRQQQKEAAEKAMNTKTSVSVYNSSDARVEGFEQQGLVNTFYGKSSEAAEILIDAMKRTQESINECRESMKGLSETSSEYKEQAEKVGELNEQYSEMSEQLAPILDNVEEIIEAGGKEADAYQSIIDKVVELNEVREESTGVGTEGIDDETDALEDNANAWDEAAEAAENAANAWDNNIASMQDISSAYDVLCEAAAMYNEQGYFTADMLAQLNSLSPEYLAALSLEGDQYGINEELLASLFEQEQNDALAKLDIAEAAAAAELAESYLNGEVQQSSTALVNAQSAIAGTEGKFYDLASAAATAAAAIQQVNAVLGDDEKASFNTDLDNLHKTFDNLRSGIKNSKIKGAGGGGGIGGGGGKKGGGGGGSGRKGGGGGGGRKSGGGGGGRRSGGGGSGGAKSAAKEHKDAWIEAFEEEEKALKHLLETEQITQYEYYEKLKDLNEKYFGEISGNHEKYIKEYNEKEEEIYKGLKKVYEKVKNYLKKAVEDGYERAINAIQKEEKAVLDSIKREIDDLKKEKDETLKSIQSEIDMLKKEKDEVEKYWNDQIEAIKRENEELEEQNQLLEYQQALEQAKAQKVMIYQDGKFQLGENESAIAQAEEALNKYQDQLAYEKQIREMEDLRDTQLETLEQRIEALEEYYDYMEEYYDRRIEAMEEYYEQVEEQYEKQIEALQNELDAFKEAYQKEEDLENARLAAQVLGMNERKDLYSEELENLKNYINEVNRMLASLGEAGATVDFSYSPKTGYHTPIGQVSSVSVSARASGDSSFKGDEIALVGESPNAELVLGSRLNNSVNSGQLLHLSRGSGIVNAESTATLAGLLNGLGNNQLSNNTRTTQQNFNFGSISLPNVTDANSFVNALSREFNTYAIQYGNIRK